MFSDKAEDEDFFVLAYAQQKSLYDREKIKYSTYKNNFNRLSLFQEYLKQKKDKDTVFYMEIDRKLLEGYILWRKDKGNTNESINKALPPLVKGIKLASTKRYYSN